MTHASVRAAPGQLRPGAVARGRGWQALVKPANPAAGGSFTYPIDATYWRRIISLAFTITTSAVAGTRSLAVAYQDGDQFTYNLTPLSNEIGPSQSLTAYGDLASVTPVQAPSSHDAENQATSPAAGATIVSLVLPSGGWTLTWQVQLQGTVGAIDSNNFQLKQGTTVLLTSVNPGAVGPPIQQETVEVQIPIGGATVTVNANALATVGAIYSAQLVASPANVLQLQVQLPDFIQKSGWQTVLQLGGAQAGDAFTGIGILEERYPSSDIERLSQAPEDQLAELILAIARGG